MLDHVEDRRVDILGVDHLRARSGRKRGGDRQAHLWRRADQVEDRVVHRLSPGIGCAGNAAGLDR